MKNVASLIVVLLHGLALAGPLTSEGVMRAARAQAAKEHKNVLVMFHASWCPWCRRFDRLFESAEFGPAFEKSYVLTKITVRERDELRKNENPGWAQTMRRLRGAAEQDVPYLAVLSPEGTKLGDSYRAPAGEIPGNAGWPRTGQEISAFLDLVRRTGKGFSGEDMVRLRAFFAAG